MNPKIKPKQSKYLEKSQITEPHNTSNEKKKVVTRNNNVGIFETIYVGMLRWPNGFTRANKHLSLLLKVYRVTLWLLLVEIISALIKVEEFLVIVFINGNHKDFYSTLVCRLSVNFNYFQFISFLLFKFEKSTKNYHNVDFESGNKRLFTMIN